MGLEISVRKYLWCLNRLTKRRISRITCFDYIRWSLLNNERVIDKVEINVAKKQIEFMNDVESCIGRIN